MYTQNLIEYYTNLCESLNSAEIKNVMEVTNGKYIYRDWEITSPATPDLTFLSICRNVEAINYLKTNSLLRNNICHFCGKTPIDDKFSFTERINYNTFSICKECYNKGA